MTKNCALLQAMDETKTFLLLIIKKKILENLKSKWNCNALSTEKLPTQNLIIIYDKAQNKMNCELKNRLSSEQRANSTSLYRLCILSLSNSSSNKWFIQRITFTLNLSILFRFHTFLTHEHTHIRNSWKK